MKLFVNGIHHDFNGQPNPKNIKKFMEQKTGPVTKEIKSQEEYKKLEESELAVAYFGEKDSDFKVFEGLASQHLDIQFYHSFESSLLELNKKVKVTVFKKFDGGKKDFLEPFGRKALEKWVLVNR